MPPAGIANPNACPVFDQLLGSRMVVANLELRFPLFGVLGVGSGYYGAFPMDFTVFGDGGLAWDSQHKPSVSRVRDPRPGVQRRRRACGSTCSASRWRRSIWFVRSSGPDKHWVWELQLQPGF